ncbi:MAG: HlyD family efflux transporter periplasmic adaptor subunit [Candidatus Pacebacteria bacterium]|nr:HlyD family efflux transporter periplasmic adaptor subunit [Candidatus Paceibacterota bacterium]MDD5357021.1 HlyD family efflux transporter periplasmic adaptor subunit [Candidatus Paceibacterota bacterium]
MHKYKKIKLWFLAHKIIGLIVVLAIVFGAYQIYKHYTAPSTEPRYILATVEKGTITSSVTGTGQVSASNQIELKAKVSGEVVALNAKTGDEIKAGSTILQIDSFDAGIELENAKIAYKDLITVEPLDIIKAQNTLNNAESSLTTAYNNALGTLTASSFDMSKVHDDLNSLLSGNGYLRQTNYGLDGTERTYRTKAYESFVTAETAFYAFQKDIVGISAKTNPEIIEAKVINGYQTANIVAKAAKDAKDAVSYTSRYAEASDTDASEANAAVSSLTATINSAVANLLSAKESIASGKRNLEETRLNLADVKNGPKETDVKSSELNVRQKEKAYYDHFITAPFNGIVGRLDVEKNDSISSGSVVGIFLSKTKIADISLNEVDIAHIKVGQKVTLTFDAVEGLSISGEVVEMDLVGTVTQGVVNYNVKVAFNTEDDRVKAGMSANAVIVTSTIGNVLAIPNSAVKIRGEKHYVEILPDASGDTSSKSGVTSSALPIQQEIEIGTAGDTKTEITSGLKEGDKIIVRTIAASASPTTSQAPSIFGGGTRTTTGGGANRGTTGR